MIDGPVDDGMIEIGDPTEEPTAPEPPPRVVIEYRERGVPWMLIPPLIVLSAVGAMIAYHKLVPPQNRPSPTIASRPPSTDAIPVPTDRPEPTVVTPPTIASANPAPVEKSAEPPPPATKPEEALTLPPAQPVTSPFDFQPESPKPVNPANFPRVQGLGFDQKALEAERKSEPTGDEALSPASKEVRPDRPAQEPEQAAPFELEKPTEVDPDLLPPDPRLARVRQQQRQAEAFRQIEADRARFHADLKLVCRHFKERGPREMKELFQRYSTPLEPGSKQLATKLLGKTGQFAGADRMTRIDVLRAVGYPEAVILDDIYISYEKIRIGARDGPHNADEAIYRAALFLLRYPPGQRATLRVDTIARPISANASPATPLPPAPGVR